VSEKTNEQVQAEPCCKVGFSGERIGRAVDAFAASLESVICGQGQPLVVRVSKETVAKLDLLVQGKVCKSRSEAALYLLERATERAEDTFEQIAQVNAKVDQMRGDLADWVQTSKA
jgi:hypothetical protein